MSFNDEVLFEEMPGKNGNLGIITLNRPSVLNSLNQNMVRAIHAQLQTWATAVHIKAVVIRGAGDRAFCAGGDLRLTYERYKTHDPALTHFFRDEYQLNRFIFHFPKPYVALLNGITMGGGVGLSLHGSHRVATERLLFAMPETGIGFFPDVGGSYFLPRLRGKFGFYLGLSGARLTSDDCVALNIAQQKVSFDALPDLLNAIAAFSFADDARSAVTQVIEQFNMLAPPSLLLAQQAAIDTCFSAQTMEEILQNLRHSTHIICKDAATMIETKSPTSLKITLRAMQVGARLDFDACMRQEYRLACHFLQGHDFLEGIRAVIVDKDHSPKWKPEKLAAVTQVDVDKYFAPLAEELV